MVIESDNYIKKEIVMKKVGLIITVMVLFISASNGFCEKNYGVEKAIITYKISGAMSGTMEITFDKYGEYTSMTTQTPEGKITNISTPDKDYMINWEEKTAMDMSMFGEGMMEDESMDLEVEEDAEIIGEETLLGKKCSIYLYKDEDGSSKSWVWENIVLKAVSESEGMTTTMLATDLKTPASIPASTFKVPGNIKIQKMPSFSLPVPGFGN